MLVLMSCTLMVMAPIMMVGGIVMAIHVDVGLSWLIAVTVPVLAAAMGLIVTRMVPSFRLMQSRIDEVNRLLREQITGVRVVRAFVREERETERFATANGELTEVATRAGRYLAAMFPIVMLVANVASVAVLWFGGHRVDAGEMQVGALTAYLAYLMQIVMAVMMGTFMMMMLPRAAVCADRDHGGAGHRDLGTAAGRAGDRPPPARHARARRRRAHLPGRGRAGAARHHVPRRARSDRGRDRLDRRGQEHAGQPGAAPVRRHRRASCGSTASTYAASLPSGSGR